MADVKTALKDVVAKMNKQLGPKAEDIKKMIKTMEAAKGLSKTQKA